MTRSVLVAAAVAAATLGSSACGSARRGRPFGGAAPLSDKARQGEIHFARHCGPCHPGGEGGLGPALNDKPLPEGVIRLQVRHGLGAMPSFSEKRLSDAQLDDIVEYLRELR